MAEEPTPQTDTEDTDSRPEPVDDQPTDQLGDAGKRALTAEREARRDAERRLREAESRVAEMEAAELRREVAAEKGLTAAQARFLAGDSREDLEAAADDLLAAFASRDTDSTRRRPRERLRSGAAPGVEPQSVHEVASRVLGRVD